MLNSIIPVIFLFNIFVIAKGHRLRPLRLFSACWLLILAPLALGVITYEPAGNGSEYYGLVLTIFLLFFFLGYLYTDLILIPREKHLRGSDKTAIVDSRRSLVLIKTLALIGMLGSLLQVGDIFASGVNIFEGSAATRDAYVSRTVGVPAQIGVLLSWGSLYSAVFIVAVFSRLGAAWRALTLLSLFSYVAIGIVSAGRQAVFQLAVVVLMSYLFTIRECKQGSKPVRGGVILLLVVGLSVAYLFFVASARNDGIISDDKIEVLRYYFNFAISTWFSGILDVLPAKLATGIVEGLVYFTSSISLFGEFLGIDSGGAYFGAFSFPLFFRRIEWLTGFSVVDAMAARSAALEAANIMPVAWYTAFSSLVSDFGIYLAPFFVFAWGGIAAWAWNRDFHEHSAQSRACAACVCLSVVYMPLSLFTADPNLLLMFLFSLIPMRYFGALRNS